MSFLSAKKSVVALLTVALAAPLAMGCAARTEDTANDAANVAVAREAEGVDMGQVASGVQGAMTAVGMFNTYMKYGRVNVSTAEILAKLDSVDADIAALQTSVGNLQSAVLLGNTNQLTLDAMKILAQVDALWIGYRDAMAKGDTTFLERLGKDGRNGSGSLQWSDLLILDNLIQGKGGLSSLLDLVAQGEEAKGAPGIPADGIGNFMAEKRLAQEKAFFLLGEAAQYNSVDVASAKTAHQQRMAEQEVLFLTRTRAYNAKIQGAAGSARAAQVQACVQVYRIGGPSSYTFYDAGGGGKIQAGFTCDSPRQQYIDARVAETRAATVKQLAAAHPLYNVLNVAGSYQNASSSAYEQRSAMATMLDLQTVRWTFPDDSTCDMTMTSDPSQLSIGFCPSSNWSSYADPAQVSFGADGGVTQVLVSPGANNYVYRHDASKRF